MEDYFVLFHTLTPARLSEANFIILEKDLFLVHYPFPPSVNWNKGIGLLGKKNVLNLSMVIRFLIFIFWGYFQTGMDKKKVFFTYH